MSNVQDGCRGSCLQLTKFEIFQMSAISFKNIYRTLKSKFIRIFPAFYCAYLEWIRHQRSKITGKSMRVPKNILPKTWWTWRYSIDAQTVNSIYLYKSVSYNPRQMKCKLYFHNLFVFRNFSGPDKHQFWISRLFHSSARHPATFPSKCINPCCCLCPFRRRSDLIVRHRVPVSPYPSPGIP